MRRAKILKVKLPRAFLEEEEKKKVVPTKDDASKVASKRVSSPQNYIFSF